VARRADLLIHAHHGYYCNENDQKQRSRQVRFFRIVKSGYLLITHFKASFLFLRFLYVSSNSFSHIYQNSIDRFSESLNPDSF
jgi:hypothetical protein